MQLLAICLISVVLVQSNHAREESTMRCRFLGFDGGGGAAPPVMLNISTSGSEVSCVLPSNGISKPLSCFVNGGVISFHSASDRKPAAKATIPPGVKSAVLVFVPADKAANALPWRVLVIDDTPKNFPDGGAHVANFHNQNIRFVIGDSKIILQSGKAHGFPMPAKRDEFNMGPVVFQFQQDGQWRTASESMLRFIPGIRYLILAFVDPSSGRPRIATYQDFLRVETPPAP